MHTVQAHLKGAMELVARLAQINLRLKDAELTQTLYALNAALVDALLSVSAWTDALGGAGQEAGEARAAAGRQDAMVRRGDVYFHHVSVVPRPVGPLCISCFDSRAEYCLLRPMPGPDADGRTLVCYACNGHFSAPR